MGGFTKVVNEVLMDEHFHKIVDFVRMGVETIVDIEEEYGSGIDILDGLTISTSICLPCSCRSRSRWSSC